MTDGVHDRLETTFVVGRSNWPLATTDGRIVRRRSGLVRETASALLGEIGFSRAFRSIFSPAVEELLVRKMSAGLIPFLVREGEIVQALNRESREARREL